MKVYLDDERPIPEGWVGAKWPQEAIALLKTGKVKSISLDHDLGDDAIGTGYDVLIWLEEAAHEGRLEIPIINIHTANPSAHRRMNLALRSIHRIARERARLNREAVL